VKRCINWIAPLACLGLLSCSPGEGAGASALAAAPAAAANTHPVSGLRIVPLTVTSKGKVHKFRVELASTPEEQGRGLMFRNALGPYEGMIFPSMPPGPRSFWMKNTPLPLDIIFVGVDGRILNIAARTTPYSLDALASQGPTSGVLELAGGRAAELGIGVGDTVRW